MTPYTTEYVSRSDAATGQETLTTVAIRTVTLARRFSPQARTLDLKTLARSARHRSFASPQAGTQCSIALVTIVGPGI